MMRMKLKALIAFLSGLIDWSCYNDLIQGGYWTE